MKNKKYSIRKTLTGVGSVAIATLVFGVNHINADELSSNSVNTTEVAPSVQSDSNVNTTESNDKGSVAATESNDKSSDTVIPTPTDTTGVLVVQDVDITNQVPLNTEVSSVDISNKDKETVSVPANADKYASKGYVYDYTVDINTNKQYKKDITVDIHPKETATFARVYRYTGLNTGDKDTLVKTDKSTTKDIYFVGATDKDGKTALEKIGNTPYLETGSMYEINGIQVWCSAPTMPATAGQKYVMKVVGETEPNALINAFGIGYADNTKDKYFLVDIEQGMMWEAQGYKHIFDRVMVNPDNTGGIRDLTADESAETKAFKEGISKAIETYKSDAKANFSINNGANDVPVSDTEEAVEELTFEEGSVPDSVTLKGNAELLHYYKNGAIKTPDGTVLTIDDVKGLATLSKLSGLTAGDYILKMSMIRDSVQGDSTEWTADGQQTMQDYRIKNPKWETVRIKVTPKPVYELPNEAPTYDKPTAEIPKAITEVPNYAPSYDKPSIDILKPITEVPNYAPSYDKPSIDIPHNDIPVHSDKPNTHTTQTDYTTREEPQHMSRVADRHQGLPNTGSDNSWLLAAFGVMLSTVGLVSTRKKVK